MRKVAAALLLQLAVLIGAPQAGAEPGWDRVNAPATSGRVYVYRAAAPFGQKSVWAAGYTYGLIGGTIEWRTVIERWDGYGWTQYPTPNHETAPARNMLFDISSAGITRAWAVGGAAPAIGSVATVPLIQRWNGVRWSWVDGPANFPGALMTVAAAPDGTVWIAGEGRNQQTLYTIPNVWLRDGSDWQEVPFPNVPGCSVSSNGQMVRAELTDIASRRLPATWATGYCATPTGERGFLVRYDGSRWIPLLTPDTLARYGTRGQMNGVSQSPDGDLWAVGWADDSGVNGRPLAFRGRYGAVHKVSAPAQGSGAYLYAVSADRNGGIVAAGTFTRRTDSAPHPHVMGPDGAGGLAVEPAEQSLAGNLYGVALAADGVAWAVGISSSDDRGLILTRTP
ncbi:MAG TPA: hypothetical protein VF250_03775 [Conexibacter sp.]